MRSKNARDMQIFSIRDYWLVRHKNKSRETGGRRWRWRRFCQQQEYLFVLRLSLLVFEMLSALQMNVFLFRGIRFILFLGFCAFVAAASNGTAGATAGTTTGSVQDATEISLLLKALKLMEEAAAKG